jgi:hypothetical protein
VLFHSPKSQAAGKGPSARVKDDAIERSCCGLHCKSMLCLQIRRATRQSLGRAGSGCEAQELAMRVINETVRLFSVFEFLLLYRQAGSAHDPTVLPLHEGIFTPFFRLRLISMRPHLSSQFSSSVLYTIFHGSSNASNLQPPLVLPSSPFRSPLVQLTKSSLSHYSTPDKPNLPSTCSYYRYSPPRPAY